ncbi:MAG: iron-containing alcohol dehydrogenase [Deltaproteobacteria bacterium]|nr:iron-containing alcohol dehydrogenase [Deltaproteobacteria bacterium]
MATEMRVLITGAQGFLGRTLTAEWLEACPEAVVMGLGRSEARAGFTHDATRRGRAVPAPLPAAMQRSHASPRASYAAVDVLDRAALLRTLAAFEPHVVIHLAARLKDDAPADLVRVNVEGTLTLLDVCAGLPRRPRLVLGSSGAVYGEPVTLPLHEAAPFGPLAGLYALTRRTAEEAALLVARREGLHLCIARIFNPIGPGLDERHLPSRVAATLVDLADGVGEPVLRLGPLDGTRDFLDARDAATALRLIATRGEAGGVYNVASGVATPVGELVSHLVAAAGLTGRVQIESGARQPGDVPHHWADVARLRALGFTPRHALPETARHLIEWYRGIEWPQVAAAASAEPPLTVTVAPRFEYPVEIGAGLLDAVPARLLARLSTRRAVVVTDPRVGALYGERLMGGLAAAGFQATLCRIPEGEAAKCGEVWHGLIGDLHQAGFERRSTLLCLGGGLVSDVGGFVAATYMRGVPYVNVPTTLLAQHDGAVGGKVAINTDWAKNALGAFHHPSAVYCDPETLRTLDARNLAAGVAEALKVALTGDAHLFALLESDPAAVLEGRDVRLLERIVRRSAARKIALLAPDPLEIDLRRALNLGHTLAHALETELHYAGLLHGEAVAVGLAVATRVAQARGECPEPVAERILALLAAYGLPPRVPRERLFAALDRLSDIRRVRGGALHFVMPVAIDAVRIVPEVAPIELCRALESVAALAPAARIEVAA